MEVQDQAAPALGADSAYVAAVRILPAAKWVLPRTGDRPLLDASVPVGLAAGFLTASGTSVKCVVRSPSEAETLSDAFRGKVEVKHGLLAALPFGSGTFGAVLCQAADLARNSFDSSLAEIRRVLDDDGVLVAIAGSDLSGDRDGFTMSERELESAVSRHFTYTTVLSQTDLLISTVGSGGSYGSSPLEIPRLTGHTRKEALVAASNRREQLEGPDSIVVNAIDLDGLTATWGQAIQKCITAQGRAARAEQAAAGRNELIRELYLSEQALAEAFDVRGRLESVVSNAAEVVLTTKPDLDAARAEIARLQHANDLAHAEVIALRSSTSWRVTRPLRALARLVKSAEHR